MMGGGGMGGYPMSSGNLVTDPQTGLLLDRSTGNLIDPTSGAVIGRRIVSPTMGMPGGMYSPYGGGMNSFSNGFSSFGGMGGMGMNSGMGMNIGGMGMGRSMGMWP